MKTYTVRDDHGKEVEISQAQMFRHMKLLLLPVLTEIGMMPDKIAAYDDDISRLIGVIIAHIRDKNTSLEVARIEFKKMRDKREADYNLMVRYIRRMLPIEDAENVINLNERRKVA